MSELTSNRTLILIDRRLSAMLGRSCSIQEEDFDLEFPLDIDDEHLYDQANHERGFHRRPLEVTRVTHFIWLLRLNQIMGYTLRTIVRQKGHALNPRLANDQCSTRSTNPGYSWVLQDLIGSSISCPNSTVHSISGRIPYLSNVSAGT